MSKVESGMREASKSGLESHISACEDLGLGSQYNKNL